MRGMYFAICSCQKRFSELLVESIAMFDLVIFTKVWHHSFQEREVIILQFAVACKTMM